MLQREVAERISAVPGEMSYLSVFVQFHAAVRIAFVVPREAFEPAPESSRRWSRSSRSIRWRAATPLGRGRESLWRLVQAGFRERRKMLRNVLVRQLVMPGQAIDRALDACSIVGERATADPRRRGMAGPEAALGPLPAERVRGAMAAPARRRPERRRPGRARGRGDDCQGAAPTRGTAGVRALRFAPAKLNLTLAVVGTPRGRLPRPAFGDGAAGARRRRGGLNGASRGARRYPSDRGPAAPGHGR